MKTFSILSSLILVSSSAFALTLFNDLNLDGNAITNVSGIQFANGQVMTNLAKGDLSMPDGYGTPVMKQIASSTTYTVPAGKSFYCLSAQADGEYLIYATTNGGAEKAVWYLMVSDRGQYGINGWHGYRNTTFESPLAFAAGTVLRADNAVYLTGFETATGAEICQIQLTTDDYTVPTGKRLYVLTAYSSAENCTMQAVSDGTTYNVWRWMHNGYFSVGGQAWRSAYFNTPLIFDAGTVLKCNTGTINLTAYLQ